jgi:uncharacterized protein
MRVVVLADTHAPRRWRTCPPRVAILLRGADMILHAGDVCTAAVLDELAEYAPVVAVAGNNDGPDVAAWGAGPAAELDIDGLAVAMVHDSGPATGRLVRMRRQFPRAELVVFGHSHIPLDISGDGFRIFNPGSPTDRRRQPAGTAGVLDVQDGLLVSASIVPVTLPVVVLNRRPAGTGFARWRQWTISGCRWFGRACGGPWTAPGLPGLL